MTTDACRKFLTDAGFKDAEVEEIINTLPNAESLSDFIKEVNTKADADKTIRISRQVSERRSKESIKALKDGLYLDATTTDPFKTLWNFLVGKNGLWINATARSEMRNARVLKEMNISNKMLVKWLDDPDFVEDLVEELNPFNGLQKTSNNEAFKLAKIITEEKRLQVFESRAYGSGLMWLDDHITATYHDPVRILGKGEALDRQIWKDTIIGLIDKRKTLSKVKSGTTIDELLDDIYDGITQKLSEKKKETGTKRITDILGEKFDRTTPLKQLMEVQRILEFNDTASILKYNEAFGYYNIGKSIFANMDMMDNHLAIGETLGYGWSEKIKKPDGTTTTKNVLPEKEINRIIETLQNTKKISPLQAWQLKAALYQVSGESFIVGNASLAKFVVGWQAWQSVTKLGKQMISSFGDMWSTGINLHYQGVSPDTAYLGMVNHLYRSAFGKVGKEEKNFLRMLGIGYEGVFGASARSIMSTPIAGRLSRMQDHFLTWNGSHGWTNWMREGFSMMSSNNFANKIISKNYADLDRKFAKLMKEYGISEKDWLKLKEIGTFNEKTFRIDGNASNNYITGDWIRQQKGPETIARKLDRFFINESKFGVPEATGKERALMYGNFNRGTLPDTVTHLFWEFRTHTMSIVMNTYPRMIELGLPGTLHMLPAVGLGYASLAAKNMLKGKEPPAYDDPAVLTDALVQSGFAGMFGDFLAGEYGRYYHKWDEATLGAGYSTFKDYGELFTGLATGNKDAEDVWKNLRYNIPYANLFYVEAAVNYGIHYGVMETFSPGYLDTLEARARANEEPFMIEPSNIWGYGGLR
tara:strand:- start:777 stop:3215 length:2439 start_codon:yes stop_codon:yes gene_type:complete